jgi:hypothetical protein
VRKAAVAGAIVIAGIGVTAVWAVARDEPPRPRLVPTTAPADTSSIPSAADGLRVVVSDADVAPGDEIAVSGTGCGPGLVRWDPEPSEPPAWSVKVWLSPAAGTVEWDPSFGEPLADVVPDVDGTWSVVLTVPEWRAEYRLEAACFDDSSPPEGFVYRHERVVAS